MKCVILSDNLKKALSVVERNTTKDLTLPILSSFLISSDSGGITVAGTNLEIGVEVVVRGVIQEQGKVAVPAKTFSAFISTSQKEEKITLETKGNDLVVTTQNQNTLFKGFPPDDFPPFPNPQEVYHITLQGDSLKHILELCLISIARNTIKPELASVYCLVGGEYVVLSSTDSFRLTEGKIKQLKTSKSGANESFLIPLKVCEEIIRISDSLDLGATTLSIGKGEMMVTFPDIKLYSRLTEGSFPDYQQIIPTTFQTEVIIKRELLVGHIKRASIFSNKLNSVSLAIEPKSNEISIESSNRDVGEYKANFTASAKGDTLTIFFNWRYLFDGISGFGGDNLFLGFNGESRPILVKDQKALTAIYIVMPMKGGV